MRWNLEGRENDRRGRRSGNVMQSGELKALLLDIPRRCDVTSLGTRAQSRALPGVSGWRDRVYVNLVPDRVFALHL